MLLATGCSKVEMNQLFRITPYLQMENKGPETLADDIIAYSFYADTVHWRLASWDDAIAGRLTKRIATGMRSDTIYYDILTGQDATTHELVCGPLLDQPVIIVLCDREHKIYGWRQVPTAANMDETYVNVRFRPWKPEVRYDEAKWTMVNEFITISDLDDLDDHGELEPRP